MIKKVVMKNLICTRCAAEIEKTLPKITSIRSASFNFANQTMLLDVTDDYDPSKDLVAIRRIVDSIEHGIDVFAHEDRQLVNHHGFFKQNWIIMVGLLVFFSGWFMDYYIGLVRSNPLYWIGYILISYKIIYKTWLGLKRKAFFNENALMFIATMAAMFIRKPYEAILVILFYSLGEYLQHRAVETSKDEINTLMDLHIEYANVMDETGKWIIKDPLAIKKGDRILIKNGERIPVDGELIKGSTSLNTSALTGESKLMTVHEGDILLSGYINVGSIIEIEAEKEYHESTISKIIDMIENATGSKSKTEAFITRFARFYTPVVTIMAVLLFSIPSILDPANIEDYVFRAATFLVISCPCALVLSIPLSYFAGIGASARHGILFKGSNYLDMMHDVEVIGIDKTGTLTYGQFVVDGYTNFETLKIAASLEKYSNHPVAQSIVNAYPGVPYVFDDIEEIAGYGMKATMGGDLYVVGSQRFMLQQTVTIPKATTTAGTNVFVAKNSQLIGQIIVMDKIRESAYPVIKSMKKRYRFVMLTGDNDLTASSVSEAVGGIDYRHSLLPSDKVSVFEEVNSVGLKMYVGDGINDAPLLKAADIGVAMGNGSQLAIDVADIVIMDDDIHTLKKAFDFASRTRTIVIQNIILSLGVKSIFLILAGLGIATMLMAIFADVGITLIAVLNALRLIYGRKTKKQ